MKQCVIFTHWKAYTTIKSPEILTILAKNVILDTTGKLTNYFN